MSPRRDVVDRFKDTASATSPSRRLITLLVVLAFAAGLLWYAGSRRNRSTVPTVHPSPTSPTSLTFEALVDSAARIETGFRVEMDTIPGHEDTRRLQSTIDYLERVTYLYYDWVIDGGAAFPSAEAFTRKYLSPAVESVAEARPELAEAHPGLRNDAVVRLYFLGHGMLMTHGVIHSTSGIGRFPSLEIAPIVKETPLDDVVWGRRIDAVAFATGDPIILDIVSYSHGVSTGANMVTLNTVVRYHLEREPEFVRSLREDFHRARHHAPAPARDADTLAEALAYVALQPYMALDTEDAVTKFMEDWRETSYMHERGHIFSKQAGLGLTPQGADEEALAYLTELRYGGNPHYTLHGMINVGVVRGIRPHKDGAEMVFAEFARRIRAARSRGEGFEAIEVGTPTESLADGIDGVVLQFPRLRADEIRALADAVFEERYRSRVKE